MCIRDRLRTMPQKPSRPSRKPENRRHTMPHTPSPSEHMLEEACTELGVVKQHMSDLLELRDQLVKEVSILERYTDFMMARLDEADSHDSACREAMNMVSSEEVQAGRDGTMREVLNFVNSTLGLPEDQFSQVPSPSPRSGRLSSDLLASPMLDPTPEPAVLNTPQAKALFTEVGQPAGWLKVQSDKVVSSAHIAAVDQVYTELGEKYAAVCAENEMLHRVLKNHNRRSDQSCSASFSPKQAPPSRTRRAPAAQHAPYTPEPRSLSHSCSGCESDDFEGSCSEERVEEHIAESSAPADVSAEGGPTVPQMDLLADLSELDYGQTVPCSPMPGQTPQSPMPVQTPQSIKARTMFHRLDEDGDGKISRTEFITAVKLLRSEAQEATAEISCSEGMNVDSENTDPESVKEHGLLLRTLGGGSRVIGGVYDWAKWGTPGFVRRKVDKVEEWVGKKAQPLRERCSDPMGEIICALDTEVDFQLVKPITDKAETMMSYIPGGTKLSSLLMKTMSNPTEPEE
eukprot:TRINITY_DN18203_c0_g1_i1.p1 TRINITY_DN18203_c0_g1~~TRINITY_DN18203_c0_g1_i1.p1  ORF type:complete len:515 (+),score=89.46 TRINITY_DN18203_c0_g1_i1:70-1614(+)